MDLLIAGWLPSVVTFRPGDIFVPCLNFVDIVSPSVKLFETANVHGIKKEAVLDL